ncbi:MAG: DNA-3-methyladenine glycosylase [Blastocatellia bacterium]|nr:DNA-3-methyladenine glycosylase [Blastocatellia bacterium]
MPYLKSDFFARDTLSVARDLVGAILVYGPCEGRIVETEAYTTDAASHALMRRNKGALMRETYGHLYIHINYGVHHCLNLTTEREGIGAVLIRAVEPVRGIEEMITRRGTDDLKRLASGPGRLCQAFHVDMSLNGRPINREIKIRERRFAPHISVSPRVGITRAADLEWRFYESGNPFVSRAPRTRAASS